MTLRDVDPKAAEFLERLARECEQVPSWLALSTHEAARAYLAASKEKGPCNHQNVDNCYRCTDCGAALTCVTCKKCGGIHPLTTACPTAPQETVESRETVEDYLRIISRYSTRAETALRLYREERAAHERMVARIEVVLAQVDGPGFDYAKGEIRRAILKGEQP